MVNLTLTDYTWFIMIGLTLGWFFDLIFENKGIGMILHLVIGVLASLFGGLVFAATGLEAELIFAMISTVFFLFLLDIYHLAIFQEKHSPQKPTTKLKHSTFNK